MRPVIEARWLEFTEPLEGGLPYAYTDIRGIVTIAYGNAVFSAADFARLPLMHPGGVAATTAEKIAAYAVLVNNNKAAKSGHLYAKRLTTIRLTREGMSDLALGRLHANDGILRGRIDGWEDLPACAQMAIHSLAWACGPAFRFPRLVAATVAGDYDVAAVHIRMNETTPEGHFNAGLVARNRANGILMRNAARVRDFRLDPDTLVWDRPLSVDDAPTMPELPAAEESPRYCGDDEIPDDVA
jgi:GH24 family phage-related lysozyme (muramidase)